MSLLLGCTEKIPLLEEDILGHVWAGASGVGREEKVGQAANTNDRTVGDDDVHITD